METLEAATGGQRPTSRQVLLTSILVFVAVLCAGWIIVSGVARKEDCSAAVGSVETAAGLYLPCDLIGVLSVTALVGLGAVVAMAIATAWKVRLVVAFITVLAVVSIWTIGLNSVGP